jgi:1-acyl-sn-glycerol-3-phosphate acyltransferase
MIIWLPVVSITYLFDRDPVKYRTGKVFRKLGNFIVAINPSWKVTITGNTDVDDRTPYVFICNHLSNADIPIISLLKWEMKWISKAELFKVPVTGWMMSMAKDIAVDRASKSRGTQTYRQAVFFIKKNCSVMYFPEGTRSRNGKLGRFAKGAFDLAVRNQVDILPLVIDGSQNCLPKNSWKFGHADKIILKVLEPIKTEGLSKEDVPELIETTRNLYLRELSGIRSLPEKEIDALQIMTESHQQSNQD